MDAQKVYSFHFLSHPFTFVVRCLELISWSETCLSVPSRAPLRQFSEFHATATQHTQSLWPQKRCVAYCECRKNWKHTENTSVDILQVFITCTRSHCLLHSMFHSLFHVMHMQFWSLIYTYMNLLRYPSYLPIICFCLSTALLYAYISSISITPSLSLRDPASIYQFIHRSGHPSIYQYMLTQVRRLGELTIYYCNMFT